MEKSKSYPHTCHDVTAFKDDFRNKFLQSPSLSNEIFLDIKNHCEVKDYFFVYYANNPRREGRRRYHSDGTRTECLEVLERVAEVCPQHDSHKNGNGRHL